MAPAGVESADPRLFEKMSTSIDQETLEGAPSRSGCSLLVPEARRDWSRQQIEGFLTDVCAELFRLEAERRQAKRTIAAEGALREDDRTSARAGALGHQYRIIESRLQDLAPVAAGLRARLELLARSPA